MSGTGAPSPVPSGASGGKRKRVTDGAGGEGVVRPPASPLVDKAARTSLVTRPAASGIYSPGADVAGTALAAHTTPTAPSMAGGAVVSGGADGTGVAPEQVHQHIIQRHRQWAAERARHGGAGPGVSPGLHLVFTHPHAPAASAPGVAIEPPPPCTPRDVSGAPVGASPYASAVAGATTPGVPQPAAAPAAHPQQQQAHATEQAYHGHTAAQPAVGGAPAPAYHHMVPAPAPPPAPVPAPAPAPPLVSARAAARATRSSARVARSTTRGKGSKGGGKGGGGGSGVGAGLDLLDDPMFFIPDGSVGSAWPFSGAWRLDKANSESMQRHLLALGVDSIAVQAADKLDIVLVVDQGPGGVTVTKRSQLGTKTCKQRYGEPWIETAGNGTKRQSTMAYDEDNQVLTNEVRFSLRGRQCRIVDTRTLSPDARVLMQRLDLHVPAGATVTTLRRYTRTSREAAANSATTTGTVKSKKAAAAAAAAAAASASAARAAAGGAGGAGGGVRAHQPQRRRVTAADLVGDADVDVMARQSRARSAQHPHNGGGVGLGQAHNRQAHGGGGQMHTGYM